MKFFVHFCIGLCLVFAVPARAAEPNKDALPVLLDRLAKTTEQEQANLIAEEVWAHFFNSGSASVDLILQRGIAAQAAENFDLASDFYADVIEFAPDFAEGWNRRAGLEYQRGEYAAALEDLAMAIKLQPRHFGAMAGLGLVFERLGSAKGAYKAYQDALAIHPFLPHALSGTARLKKQVEGRQL